MKKFNAKVESDTYVHRFSFEALDRASALERLKLLGLNCTKIIELPDSFKGTIRNPEQMYS